MERPPKRDDSCTRFWQPLFSKPAQKWWPFSGHEIGTALYNYIKRYRFCAQKLGAFFLRIWNLFLARRLASVRVSGHSETRAPSAEITYLYLRAWRALESHAALAQSWRIGGVERLRRGTAQQRHGAGAEAAMLPYGPLCEASRSSLSVLFGAEVAPPPRGPPYDALRSSRDVATAVWSPLRCFKIQLVLFGAEVVPPPYGPPTML